MNKNLKKCFYTAPLHFVLFTLFHILYSFSIVQLGNTLGEAFDVGRSHDVGLFYNLIITSTIILISVIVLALVVGLLENKYLEKVIILARKNIFFKITRQSMPDYLKENNSAYQSSLINEMNLLDSQYFRPKFQVFKQIISLIIALVVTITINPLVTIFIVLMSSISIFLPKIFTKKLIEKFNIYTHELKNYTLNINEMLDGFLEYKVYFVEDLIAENHKTSNKLLANNKKKAYSFLDLVSNIAGISSIFVIIGVLILGMFLALGGYLTVGEVFALSFISSNVSEPIRNILDMLPKITSSRGVIDKFNRISVYNDRLNCIDGITNGISFKDVKLTLDKPILKGINFNFECGKKYLLVGESGSGKSTLMKLILGYFEEYSGELLLDETDLKFINNGAVFENISYIPQSNVFFEGTIKDNVTLYDKQINDEEVLRALEMAEIKNRVLLFEKGIYEIIDDDFSIFSGGEKQRLAIARSILGNKKIRDLPRLE